MINAEWHLAHPMPKHATLDERVAWHVEHAAACGCREMPRAIRDEMKRRGVKVHSPTERERRDEPRRP